MQISVPGIGGGVGPSGIDTQKLINDLVEAERQPIVRIEEDIKTNKVKQKVWRTTDNSLTLLSDNAKELYSFTNPFRERITNSSDPQIVVATATRNASIGDYVVYIKDTATADRWLSKKISEDYEAPQGEYVFEVGQKTIDFTYSGNSLDELIEQINTKGKNYLKASIIKQGNSNSDNVLLLESLVVGEDGTLVLKNNAEFFAKEIELIGTKESGNLPLNIRKSDFTTYIGDEALIEDSSVSPLPNDATKETSRIFLNLKPGAAGVVSLESADFSDILENPDATISLSLYPIRFSDISNTESNSTFDATLEDITVQATEKPFVSPSNIRSDNTEEIQDNKSQLTLLFNKEGAVAFSLQKSQLQEKTPFVITLPVQDIIKNTDALEFTISNPFPQYKLVILNAVLSENKSSSELVPLQPIDRAKNAVVNFNGIDLNRNKNDIDDIIPGINLDLKRADADRAVTISVASDDQSIKDAIIAFIGAYNQAMRDLTIYTRTDDEIFDQLQFASSDEQTRAEENLGIFSDQFDLTQLLNNMQSAVLDQYNNNLDPEVGSLRSIGISSNLNNNNNTFNALSSKFLDIDETVLDNAIASKSDAIASLLGTDTNGDVAIDYGIAFRINTIVTRYVQTGGIITQRQRTLEASIKRDEDDLQQEEDRLVSYEQELRRKFGTMDQIVGDLKNSGSAVDRLNNKNNNNNNN